MKRGHGKSVRGPAAVAAAVTAAGETVGEAAVASTAGRRNPKFQVPKNPLSLALSPSDGEREDKARILCQRMGREDEFEIPSSHGLAWCLGLFYFSLRKFFRI